MSTTYVSPAPKDEQTIKSAMTKREASGAVIEPVYAGVHNEHLVGHLVTTVGEPQVFVAAGLIAFRIYGPSEKIPAWVSGLRDKMASSHSRFTPVIGVNFH